MLRADFRKPSLLYPSARASTLPTPAPFQERFQPAVRRTRVKPTATSREYRRTVHHAELAAWEANLPAAQADLRAAVAAAVKDSPAEKWAFRIITTMAAMGIVWGLVNSFQLVEHWPQFVAAIRQLLL